MILDLIVIPGLCVFFFFLMVAKHSDIMKL